MPIITAFQGTITVEGTIRGSSEENTRIYKEVVKAYGETIGELLDNLVEASVTVANDLFSWLTLNRPEDYALKNDYWYISLAHPEILETVPHDTGSGSSLESVEGVVRFATLIRDIHIKSTATWLLLQNNEKSEIVDNALVPYNGIYEVTSFNEMTKFGFTGAELDTILEIGEREGRVKKYRDDLNIARNYRKKISAANEASFIKAPQKWWQKLVGSN